MAAEPPNQKRPLSPWAVATLACALSLFCPVASLAGLVVAARAVVDLRRRPQRRGGRMVAAGVVICTMSLAAWAMAGVWWNVSVRQPMLRGPLGELAAGLAGDLGAFQAGFVAQTPPTPPAAAAAFLDEVAARYGRLIGSVQRTEPPAPPPESPAESPPESAPLPGGPAPSPGVASVDFSRMQITYTFLFDSGPVDAESEFVVTMSGVRGFVLKFSWLAIRDRNRGELCYPPGACPGAAGAAP